MILHDAHNHLHFTELGAHRERILDAWTRTAGPSGLMMVNGTHPDDWPAVATLAATAPCIRPAYGLHPWDAGAPRPPDWLADLEARLLADPAATIGEIGLDRWLLDARPDDPRLAGVVRAPIESQTTVFLAQLAIAARHQRAASIHCLRAHAQMLELLRRHPRPAPGFLLHAYSGPAELVPAFAELGAYFSFNTAFLDEARHAATRAAFHRVPPERLLIETDAPAMPPPHVWRTHRLPGDLHGAPLNHPANIEVALLGLATLRGEDPAVLARQLAANFHTLFSARP